MAILIDILLVLLLLGFAAAGLRFGLFRSLAGLVGSLAALVLSVFLGNLLAQWLYTGVFRGPMVDQISQAMSEGGIMQTQTEAALNALPGFIGNALHNLGISAGQVGQAAASSAEPFAQGVADCVSPVVIHLTALVLTVLLFIGLRTGIFFVIRLLDRFFRLPVLNTLNRIGGGIFGLLKGAVVTLLLATVTLVVTPLLPPDASQSVTGTIDTSYVCRWVYENNPLRPWFTEQGGNAS